MKSSMWQFLSKSYCIQTTRPKEYYTKLVTIQHSRWLDIAGVADGSKRDEVSVCLTASWTLLRFSVFLLLLWKACGAVKEQLFVLPFTSPHLRAVEVPKSVFFFFFELTFCVLESVRSN